MLSGLSVGNDVAVRRREDVTAPTSQPVETALELDRQWRSQEALRAAEDPQQRSTELAPPKAP